jgi:DNA-binding transcriptional MerR regulator
MAHEIAKLLLEKAGTFLERTEAIQTAQSLGMPLHEIEEYLDWVDVMRVPDGDLEQDSSESDESKLP